MSKSKRQEIITITVKNWDKYQGEIRKNSRAKSFDWWARSNQFYRDEKMRSLGAIGRDLFASILDRCSERNANVISSRCEHLLRDTSVGCGGHRSITRASLVEHLKLMKDLEIIDLDFTHNITEQNKNRTEQIDDGGIKIPRAIISISHPHPPPNKPMSLDPFVPKPDETPYAEIINLWNQICVPPKRRIEIFQAGPMRQEWIKQHWLKHPDMVHWETWMRAYAKSFWVLDPNERDNPKCPEFYKLLEKPDLIYGLLDGSYAFVDVAQANRERERKERIALLEAAVAEDQANRSRGA